MRGKPQAQPEFLTTINLNQRVLSDHPLRGTGSKEPSGASAEQKCALRNDE